MYNTLFAKLILTDAHRAELKNKRGLTDEIIDSAILRSGGPHNDELITEYCQGVPKSRLRTLQILNGDEPNNLFFNDKVIIPYIDDQNEIDYFRCHKFGLRGRVPPVYLTPKLDTINKQWLILAESEFKALAAASLGFHAIASPGCAVHISKNFPMLVEAIKKSGADRVIILWDNEDKVDPKSPKYKPEVESRYDVEAWEFVMATKIAFACDVDSCRIARLPDEWRIDGKIDIDAAVAAGHTADEFKAIIKNSFSPAEYRATWSEECEKTIRRKIDKMLYRSPITEEFGKYYADTKNGSKYPISNFTMSIEYNYLDRKGDDFDLQRGIRLVDQYAQTSPVFQTDTDTLTGLSRFKSWTLSKGPYNFKGSQKDLDHVVDLVTNFDENPVIERPMIFGWCEFMKAYILGNIAIGHDGTVYHENANGVIMIGKRGVKVVNPDDEMNVTMRMSDKDITASEVIRKTYQNWGSWDIVLALGWTLACPFVDILSKKYGCFPICSISGVRESGKTSLAQVITDICGLKGSIGKNIETTTVPGVERTLDVFSNLPLWIDEYRSTEDIQRRWDSYFRSVYNRQGSTKADRQNQDRVVSRRIRGAVLITGETPPAESALSSRCIRVEMPEKYTGSTWIWINANRDRFSSIYKMVAMQRFRSDEYISLVEKASQFFVKNLRGDHQITERYALNYAIVCAALTMFAPDLFNSGAEEREFTAYVIEHAHSRQIEGESDHISVSFIRDLATMRNSNERVAKQAFCLKNINEAIHAVIHIPTAYAAWKQFQRSQGAQDQGWSRQSIVKALTTIGWTQVTCTIDGKNYTCMRSEVRLIKDAQLRQELEELNICMEN